MENQLVETLSLDPRFLMRILLSLFIAILFIQSGLDKVVNWKAEKSFYTEHFRKTFLHNTVPVLMPIITVSELAAGLLSGGGLFLYVIIGNMEVASLGMLMACLSILQLFFGQRVAKDYAGAAVLVPYFLTTIVGLYFYLF